MEMELRERLARLEEQIKQIIDINARLSKIERHVWLSTGALAMLQIIFQFFKH
jgi:hypothetical protein